MNIDAAPFVASISKLVEASPNDVVAFFVDLAPTGGPARHPDAPPDFIFRRVPAGFIGPEPFVATKPSANVTTLPQTEFDSAKADEHLTEFIEAIVGILRKDRQGCTMAFVPHVEKPFPTPRDLAAYAKPSLLTIGAKKVIEGGVEIFRLTWQDQDISHLLPDHF